MDSLIVRSICSIIGHIRSRTLDRQSRWSANKVRCQENEAIADPSRDTKKSSHSSSSGVGYIGINGNSADYFGKNKPASVSPSGKTGKCLMLVRSCRPTEAQVERMLQWKRECENSGVDFLLSVDNTWSPASSSCRSFKRPSLKSKAESASDSSKSTSDSSKSPNTVSAIELVELFGKDSVHMYDVYEIERKYPVWIEIRKQIKSQERMVPGRFYTRTLAWGMHNECVLDALEWRSSRWKTASQYDYVWVFEDDVGFSGDVSSLFAAYDSDDSDLLTKEYRPNKDSAWCWHHSMTGSFYRKVGKNWKDCWSSAEHVQRFSKRFINEIHEWSTTHEATAWSELSTPTICMWNHAFKCNIFRAKHVGDQFSWDGRVERERWVEMNDPAANDPKSNPERNRMYHALKF